MSGIHVLGLGWFHLAGVDIHPDETGAVSTYPDVTIAVAAHAVDGVVDADTRQTQFVADVRVPLIGTLVVDKQGSLTVQPDVVHLVGKGFQRVGVTQVAVGYLVGLPDGVLLVHDVAAGDASVFVDDECSVTTLADRADVTLRYTAGIVGIAKLKEGLLLHVVTEHTLVGDGSPYVLVLVNVNDGGDGLDTHPGEGLLHVAFERLALRVIDAVAGGRADPERTVECLLYAVDIAVG